MKFIFGREVFLGQWRLVTHPVAMAAWLLWQPQRYLNGPLVFSCIKLLLTIELAEDKREQQHTSLL